MLFLCCLSNALHGLDNGGLHGADFKLCPPLVGLACRMPLIAVNIEGLNCAIPGEKKDAHFKEYPPYS